MEVGTYVFPKTVTEGLKRTPMNCYKDSRDRENAKQCRMSNEHGGQDCYEAIRRVIGLQG